MALDSHLMKVSFTMTKELIGKAANIKFMALVYKWKASPDYVK